MLASLRQPFVLLGSRIHSANSEPIRLLETPRSLSEYKLNTYIILTAFRSKVPSSMLLAVDINVSAKSVALSEFAALT